MISVGEAARRVVERIAQEKGYSMPRKLSAWEYEPKIKRLRAQRNFFAGSTVAGFALFLLELFR